MLPWQQQTDEPDSWFDRFDRYLRAGASRSLLSIYNKERQDAGKKPLTSVPKSWRTKRDEWQWEERAAQWDEHLRQQEHDSLAEVRERAKEIRTETIRALHGVLGKIINKIGDEIKHQNKLPDIKEFKDLALATSIILKESRIELGEPTDITDVQSKGERLGVDMNQMASLFGAIGQRERNVRNND